MKVFLYVYLFIKNSIRQLDTKYKKIATILLLFIHTVIIPVLLAIVFYPFLKENLGLLILLPFIVMFWDIDKSINRVKFSEDIKKLFQLRFTLLQYVLAKDLCKFYNRLIFLAIFCFTIFFIQMIDQFSILTILEYLISLIFLMVGYCFRIFLILKVSLTYNVMTLGITNYILLLMMSFALYLNRTFHVFSSYFFIYHIFSLLVYSISTLLLFFWLGKYRHSSLQLLYDTEIKTIFGKTKKIKSSLISDCLLKYELLLLFRNPPMGVSIILLIMALSFGLLGVLVYVFKNNPAFVKNFNQAVYFTNVMMPAVISSYGIQSFVSFDLDGKIMTLKKNNPTFILNKIKMKERISILFNLFLFILYTIISVSFFNNISIRTLMISFLSYIILSISIVTSTIAFPYFHWNYIYEIPSTLSKILLGFMISITLYLGAVGAQGNFIIWFVVISTQLILIKFLLSVNRVLWKITIDKNFYSVRLLKE
ncbi:hypothetical protein [Fervidibacillus albus]|uniref:Uncharacterized protein n=1 Tax=Fervidibacillus albus TaxID=2980026 RepID=A0A9E8LU17_9BACI|nr:hypothetical protein [Fervidibacillus albus]WAA09516.1 hypothetical protein OE104_13450 [Fervidibacillus albus]